MATIGKVVLPDSHHLSAEPLKPFSDVSIGSPALRECVGVRLVSTIPLSRNGHTKYLQNCEKSIGYTL
jgi:hypothetical protein